MGRVALITGGSRGIGKSFARALLGQGFDVAITAARDGEAMAHTAAELATEFGAEKILAFLSEAGDLSAAQNAVEAVAAHFGRLDVLVNNAGRGPVEGNPRFHVAPQPFWQMPPEAWEETIRANVTGPFGYARAAAPIMTAAGWGRIVNISTSLATMIKPGFTAYGPSKAALDVLTRQMALDLEGSGVTVNVLAPGGPTETAFIPQAERSGVYAALLPVTVMDDALVWLCSEAADTVSGARIIGKMWDPANPQAAREDTGAAPRTL